MELRCCAIDDEPFALRQIGAYIEKTPFLKLVSLCNSGLAALEIISSEKIDLLFVDINMPDLNGMDLVKSLKEKPYIVFTTAHTEYAVEGFRVNAADYLLKPIGYNDFLKSVNKVRALAEMKNNVATSAESKPGHIFVKSEYKLVRINLADIKYVESMHEYVRIHIAGERPVMTLMSMKAMEEQLPLQRFMRVHRSYIVNLDMVKVVERNRIVFDNDVFIPVGEQYREQFQRFIGKNNLL
jgi:DNA-binding LytR/AlgR family response regulator